MVTSVYIYTDEWKPGGYYMGDVTVPPEVYGYDGHDHVFKVTGVGGLYRNALTSITLPETISLSALSRAASILKKCS